MLNESQKFTPHLISTYYILHRCHRVCIRATITQRHSHLASHIQTNTQQYCLSPICFTPHHSPTLFGASSFTNFYFPWIVNFEYKIQLLQMHTYCHCQRKYGNWETRNDTLAYYYYYYIEPYGPVSLYLAHLSAQIHKKLFDECHYIRSDGLFGRGRVNAVWREMPKIREHRGMSSIILHMKHGKIMEKRWASLACDTQSIQKPYTNTHTHKKRWQNDRQRERLCFLFFWILFSFSSSPAAAVGRCCRCCWILFYFICSLDVDTGCGYV